MAEKVIVDIQARDNASQAFDNVAKSADNMGKSVDTWTKKAVSWLKWLNSAIESNREGFENIRNISAGVFVWIAWLWTIAVATAGKFERYNSILTNALGSQSEAVKAMQMIKDTASKTPFEVDQLTESYIKLVNRGFRPTAIEITKLWDLASSQWKSFDQLVEAMLDAQTWEFERLKEFWVKASASWNQVAFTFRGVTTTVAKTENAIRDYVLALGETKGISWSMAAQSSTLEWRLSNLQDSLTSLASTFWEQLLPVIKPIVDWIIESVTSIQQWISANPTLATSITTVVFALSWMLAVILTLWLALPALTAWLTAVWAAISFVGLPILAIIATLSLLYVARQNNFLWIQDIAKQFRDYMVQWWNIFTSFLTTLWASITTGVLAFWEWLKMAFMAWVDLIVAVIWWFIWVIVWIFQAFYLLLQWEWQWAWDTVLLIFTNIWTSIVAFIWPILESIRTAIVAVFTRIWARLKTTWDAIKKSIFDAITAVVSFFTGDGKKNMEAWFMSMVSWLTGIAKSILNWVISVFEGMINFAIDGINKLVKAANAVSPIQISEVPRISIGRLAHWGIAWSGWRGWEAMSMAWAFSALASKFAFGGVVQWPWWLDNVPAMLSPWELVLNRAQQGALASQLNNNGWSNINISVSGNFYGDDKEFAQKIGDTIIKEFMTHYAWEWF